MKPRELSSTQVTLKEALEVKKVTKKIRIAEKKVLSLQRLNDCTLVDFNYLAKKFQEVEEQNLEMSENLTSVQNELATITNASSIAFN